MDRARVTLCLVVLVAACAGVYTYYAYAAPQSWDETFHIKSSLVSPADFSSEEGYGYATDHPSIKRHVYRWVLHAEGVRTLDIPDVDYSKTPEWNEKEGRLPPLSMVIPLRLVNGAFVTGALVMVFWAAHLILGNAYLALLVAVPLVASERIALGVVGYAGCDAMLAFFLAASLLTVVALAKAGKETTTWGALALGAAAGLAASAKFNGALAGIAACAYLALAARGSDRFWKPLLAALAALVVFAALNPVIRGGGLNYALAVASDMLGRRKFIWESQYNEWPLSRAALLARFWPYAAFAWALLGALVVLRREKWTLGVSVWAAVLVAGTLLSVNRTYARYFLPVEMGTFFAGGAAAWRMFQVAGKGREEAGGKKRGVAGRFAKAVAAGAVAGVLVLSVAAAAIPIASLRGGAGRAAHRLGLFYRQSAAYYGLGQRPAEVAQATRGAEPIVGPRAAQALATAAFIGACWLVFAAGRAALGSGWLGALLVLPLIWTDETNLSVWTHSVSEGFFLFFSSALIYLWVKQAQRGSAATWREALALSTCAAAAAAASPIGMLFVAATAAWLVGGTRNAGSAVGRFAKAVASAAIGAALLPVFEAIMRHLGARATYDFVAGMRSGALSLWTARFAGTSDFLMPVNECFPWWGLLPLAAAAWYAARRERWAGPAAVWAGFVVIGTIFTMSSRLTRMPVEVNLALAVGAGLPGLWILARNISIKVRLAEPPKTVEP